ncbi:hypothetical protein FG877_15890 [Enterococcus casseliflavus]|nr:hypothetical protein [Enterococcus casseliflavus]
MEINKIIFTAFIYKMSCLEFSYFLIKYGHRTMDLNSDEVNEIEFIITNALHKRLFDLRRKSFNLSKVKLTKEAQLIYRKLKKYEHLIDI